MLARHTEGGDAMARKFDANVVVVAAAAAMQRRLLCACWMLVASCAALAQATQGTETKIPPRP